VVHVTSFGSAIAERSNVRVLPRRMRSVAS
jgi:hypothetical protein